MSHKAFDASEVRRLAAGQSIAFPQYPGLRITARDTKRTWTYRYAHPETKQQKQMRLGIWPALDFAHAVITWEAARAARDKGIDIGAEQRAAKREAKQVADAKQRATQQTVGWLVEEYLTHVVDPVRKVKGAKEARRLLERFTKAKRGKLARDLTRDEAHEIIAAAARGDGRGALCERQALMTRQELRAAWEHGLARGVVEANVFAGKTVGGKFKAKKRDRHLSDDEAGQLLRWWDQPGTHSRTVRDALELTMRTGMRSGEVCGIHTDELNERNGVLWLDIPAERMKQGRPHSVPLVGRARTIVDARRAAGDGFLFAQRGGRRPIAQKVLGVEVYACSGRSDAPAYASRPVCPVTEWAPHDLRRTARTMLAEMGCPFEVAEAILAHALPGVAAVYSHARHDAAKVEWLTKLGSHLDVLAAGTKVVRLKKRA